MGITRTVIGLIVANVAMYVLQIIGDAVSRGGFSVFFGLSTGGVRSGYLWQLVTYMFLHGNPFHLLVNMLVLFFIGPETERGMGTRHFLILYFLSGILGGFGWFLTGSWGLCVGASGAIFGILGAFATMYPQRRITLLLFFVLPITMKAWILVGCLALVEMLALISRAGGNVAYAVHLGGVVVGAIYAWVVFRKGWQKHASGKTRFRIIPGGGDEAKSPEDIDELLDKIARQGLGSLTRKEREALERASKDRGRGR